MSGTAHAGRRLHLQNSNPIDDEHRNQGSERYGVRDSVTIAETVNIVTDEAMALRSGVRDPVPVEFGVARGFVRRRIGSIRRTHSAGSRGAADLTARPGLRRPVPPDSKRCCRAGENAGVSPARQHGVYRLVVPTTSTVDCWRTMSSKASLSSARRDLSATAMNRA